MKIIAANIDWDTDGEDIPDLPQNIEIPADVYTKGIDAVSDYISNETGFCHNGFEVKIHRI